jgi:hypothetical protein
VRFNRRVSNGDQTYRIAGLAMKRKQSGDFTGIGRGIFKMKNYKNQQKARHSGRAL